LSRFYDSRVNCSQFQCCWCDIRYGYCFHDIVTQLMGFQCQLERDKREKINFVENSSENLETDTKAELSFKNKKSFLNAIINFICEEARFLINSLKLFMFIDYKQKGVVHLLRSLFRGEGGSEIL